MDWRRAGSPTYGRRRSPAAGLYSAPASPAHPALGSGAAPTASPVHPLAARSKARAAAAMAHAMSRQSPRHDAGGDGEDLYGNGGGAYDPDEHAGAEGADGNGRYYSGAGGRSPLLGGAYGGYGGRSPLHPAAGGGVKENKYLGFALPKSTPSRPRFVRGRASTAACTHERGACAGCSGDPPPPPRGAPMMVSSEVS